MKFFVSDEWRWICEDYGPKFTLRSNNSIPTSACMLYVLSCFAAFFGRVMPSAVQKRVVNFLVSCVRRSWLRCSGIHGWMSRTCWMIALNFTDPVAIQLCSIGYSCGPEQMILNRMKGWSCVLVFSSSQATGCGLGPAFSCRVPALDVGPKKWLVEWPQHLTTQGTGFWCNSSSATLYRFFLTTSFWCLVSMQTEVDQWQRSMWGISRCLATSIKI
jgi:hypothetical protein